MLNSVFFKVLILTSRLAAIGRILRTQLLKTDKEIWLINRWHKTNQETSWVRASHQKRMRPLCKKNTLFLLRCFAWGRKKRAGLCTFHPLLNLPYLPLPGNWLSGIWKFSTLDREMQISWKRQNAITKLKIFASNVQYWAEINIGFSAEFTRSITCQSPDGLCLFK